MSKQAAEKPKTRITVLDAREFQDVTVPTKPRKMVRVTYRIEGVGADFIVVPPDVADNEKALAEAVRKQRAEAPPVSRLVGATFEA